MFCNVQCLIEVIDERRDQPPKYYFPTTANSNSQSIDHLLTKSVRKLSNKLSYQRHNSLSSKPSTSLTTAIELHGRKEVRDIEFSGSEYSSTDEKNIVAKERRYLKSTKRTKAFNQSNPTQNSMNFSHKSKIIPRTKHIAGQGVVSPAGE